MNVIKNLREKSHKDYTLGETIIYAVIIFLIICFAFGIMLSFLLSMFSHSILLFFLAIFFGILEIFPIAIYFYVNNNEGL